MKKPCVLAFVAAFGVIGCGGAVDNDSGLGAGGAGMGGATGGGGGSAAVGGSGGVPSACTGLSEAECQAQPSCRADHCECPGLVGYVGCTPAEAPPTPCPLSCPLMPCTVLGTQDACQARIDCHSVYTPNACDCDACCCTLFNHCAEGGTADCKGPANCDVPAPDCANPFCNGMFALGYSAGCYEGCVLTKQCAAP